MKLTTMLLAFGLLVGSVFAIGCSAKSVASATEAFTQVTEEAASYHGGRSWGGRSSSYGYRGGYRGLGARYYAARSYSYGRGWGYGYSRGWARGYSYAPGYRYARGYSYAPGYYYGRGYSYVPGYSYGPGYRYGRSYGYRPVARGPVVSVSFLR